MKPDILKVCCLYNRTLYLTTGLDNENIAAHIYGFAIKHRAQKSSFVDCNSHNLSINLAKCMIQKVTFQSSS